MEGKMDINIKKATVLLTNGPDRIMLQTDLPCPFVPESGIKQLCLLHFDASYDTGVKYVKEVFGLDAEAIDVR
jgi:hypothetical protein